MRVILSLFAGLFLVGCTAANVIKEDVGFDENARAVSDFTLADLKAANQLAIAAGDEKAKACYPALIRFVEQDLQPYRDVTTEAETVNGLFVKYQRARNLRRAVGDGVPEYIEIACSSMVNDSRSFIFRLLNRIRSF